MYTVITFHVNSTKTDSVHKPPKDITLPKVLQWISGELYH